MRNLKEKFVAACNWAQEYWLALVVFLTLIWMAFLCAVAASWIYGYWSNGLYCTKFELSSCWTGIAAILAGFASILALAKAAWTKYKTDSELNSPVGEFFNVKGRHDDVRKD